MLTVRQALVRVVLDDMYLSLEYPLPMVTRIGPRNATRLFLREWRLERGLTQQQLADRVGTSKGQVSNWEQAKRGLRQDVQAALAHALSISINDLYRDPAQPSADELLRDATPELRNQAIELIKTLIKTAAR